MIAVAGDDAESLPGSIADCKSDGDRLLPDIEVAEAADQAEAVELARLLLEPADEEHVAVEAEEFVLRRFVRLRFGGAFAIGGGGCGRWASGGFCH